LKTIPLRRIFSVGAVAIIASILVNLGIKGIAGLWFHPSPSFIPLSVGPIIFWSVVCGLGAVLVFALVVRRSIQPVLVYTLIAIGVYVLTFIPDGLLLFSNPSIVPGTTVYAVLSLMAMHAAEAIIMLLTLVILAGRSKL
jgi:Family of unknown function (DUF6069)